MIHPLTIQCPVCNEVSDLYLSINSDNIVLECPCCNSRLLWEKGHIDSVSDDDLTNISKMSSREAAEIQTVPVHHEGAPISSRTGPISHDDIANLRIELATCTDINEFINRMN